MADLKGVTYFDLCSIAFMLGNTEKLMLETLQKLNCTEAGLQYYADILNGVKDKVNAAMFAALAQEFAQKGDK